MASIKEVAEQAGKVSDKQVKEVLAKAKELGFKVRAVNSTISDDDAAILYEYITSGKLPDGFTPSGTDAKAPKTSPASKQAQKESKKTSEVVDQDSDETQSPKAKSQKKTTTKTTRTKKDSAPSKASKEVTPLPELKEAIVVEEQDVKKTSSTRKLHIVSKGKEEDKAPIAEVAKVDSKEQKPVAAQEVVPATPVVKEAQTESKSDEPPKRSEVKQVEIAPPVPKSKSMSDLALPQGFDPTPAAKVKVSAIRVVSRKDGPATKKNKSEASPLLDRIKQTGAIERREKPKKKKEKPVAAKQNKNSQIITMERGMGDSGFFEEQDEIVLIDFHEEHNHEQVEEERAKKAELNDKIKLNRYSPWMKEGSIARSSRGRGKKSRDRRSREGSELVSSLVLPEEVRVYEFAQKANLELGAVLGKLFSLGVKMLKNDFLDRDTIEILASEYGIEVTIQANAPLVEEEEILESDLSARPPVVTIMGHVDHGKTSLLDYIRNSRVASSEAGGITQHIGAYMVKKNDRWISFIDTPGHEAFAQMRSRGAQVTDIAVIVIAADDGVKQQSIEALNHAKSAQVQVIIAMNKMDKEGANPDRLKTECSELGFVPVEWGGDYEFIPISAKTGEGVDVLLETILLQADILDLKASQKARAKAIVLEGSQQVGRGSVATVIVQQGVLEVGQSIVADTAYGKIRTLRDDRGIDLARLEPSGVAQITGLSEIPLAGSLLQVVESDSLARELANKRSAYLRQRQLSKTTKVSFDELSSMVAKGQVKTVPVILRTDTQGSLEALKASLEGLNNQEVEVAVISYGVGGITQSDLDLANASNNCVVLGFNVRPTSEIKNRAKDLGLTIKSYSVIYDLIDDMKALLSGLMSPIVEEEVVGVASIRDTFIVAKLGTIAGCMVIDGKVERSLSARVLRNGVVLWSGKILSLKRFKDDVKEVNKGYECGIMLDGFNDVAVQDELEIFKEVQKQRVL